MTWQVKWRNHKKTEIGNKYPSTNTQKSRITDSYGKTKYLGRIFTKNEVAFEKCWIRENFEFSEPDFYKQVTTVICDETWHKTYIVPVGRCSLKTSQYEHNFLDMHSNALTCIGESNKKKERVPDGPTIKYSQGIQNPCIISSLASALYYMGDELASEYIIKRKQLSLAFIHGKGRMQFCRDTIYFSLGCPIIVSRQNCIRPLPWM